MFCFNLFIFLFLVNTGSCSQDEREIKWTAWSDCTVTCGKGSQTRKQNCSTDNVEVINCSGEASQTVPCNTEDCFGWSPWSWAGCSTTCGGGTKVATRKCLEGQSESTKCEGKSKMNDDCNTVSCPVWRNWQNWESCSKTCGGGRRSRTRMCEHGESGERGCEGGTVSTEDCNTKKCPYWSSWSSWSQCSVTCGDRTVTRTRSCIGGSRGEDGCRGEINDDQRCNLRDCPIWRNWQNWESCSKTCGGGSRSKTRICEHGVSGQTGCEGDTISREDCNTEKCPSWSLWSPWSHCSVTCGDGTVTRNRSCIGGTQGEDGCRGEVNDYQRCHLRDCPTWSQWSGWSECYCYESHKTRTCKNGNVGGEGCEGKVVKYRDCNRPERLLMRGEQLFVFSDEESTFDEAEKWCKSLNGKIAQISNRKIFKKSLKMYLKDSRTVSVKVYQKRNSDGAEILYKYRTEDKDVDVKDITSMKGFKAPSKGELQSFRLYKSMEFFSWDRDFNRQVKFCWSSGGSNKIVYRYWNYCRYSWKASFILYGGSSQTKNTIPVYNLYSDDFQTSKLSLFLNESTGWRRNSTIYLPDISLFIGARSGIGETSWVWDDGKVVKSQKYPVSNESKCEQMTWPLTYNDGINLRPKDCELGKSFSICSIKLSAKLEPVLCDATSLNLSWNPMGNAFEGAKVSQAFLEIFLKDQLVNATKHLNFSILLHQSSIILDDLKPRTRYQAKISYLLGNCTSFQLRSSTDGATGFGVPDPVTSAHIASDEASCTIVWKHNSSIKEIAQYKIIKRHNYSHSEVIANISYDAGVNSEHEIGEMSYKVELSKFEINETTVFEIQAVSDCGLDGELVEVAGQCSLNENSQATIIAIISLLLVCLIALGTFIYRKRSVVGSSLRSRLNSIYSRFSKKKTDDASHRTPVLAPINEEIPLQTSEPKSSHAQLNYENLSGSEILAAKLEQTYFKERKKKYKNLKGSYQKVKEISDRDETSYSVASANKAQNRYKNIYPYDHAIVPLPYNKYINAAFLEGFDEEKKFIATQGPKRNTVDDFWDMIWMHNSLIIVMLCSCIEDGKSKCEKYWPSLRSVMHTGSLVITTVSEDTSKDLIKRKMMVKSLQREKRTVTQFQYIGWPDHDIPASTTSMTKLRKRVNAQYASIEDGGPIVVHCSAGAGRTGTYIAIDNLIEELEKTKKMDAERAVMKMRRNRKDMVQNLDQYLFIHKMVVEHHIIPETEIDVETFLEKMDNNVNWLTERIAEEFPFLSNVVLTTPATSLATTTQERRRDGFPSQVKFFSGGKSHLMDAHFVKSHIFPGRIVVSSEPEQGKEELFWEMIMERNVCCLVTFEKRNALTKMGLKVGEHQQFGNVKIMVETDDKQLMWKQTNQLTVTSKIMQRSASVTHVTVQKPIEQKDFQMSFVKQITSDVIASLERNPESAVMFYSSESCNQIGIFLTLANEIDAINVEGKIDVFRTVIDLQDCRPTILNSQESYRECYECINQYLKHLSGQMPESIYENVQPNAIHLQSKKGVM